MVGGDKGLMSQEIVVGRKPSVHRTDEKLRSAKLLFLQKLEERQSWFVNVLSESCMSFFEAYSY
jgi:hypothetical protein